MKALSFLTISIIALPFAVQASTITDPSSVYVDAGGEKVFLNAGVYRMSVTGGAWNEIVNPDCFETKTTDWSDAFDMKIGGQATTDYSLKNDPVFSSGSSALTAYKDGILYDNGVAASTQKDVATFTIAPGGEYVQFDLPKCGLDNGVTLSLVDPPANASATPEPSTFGLMGLVLFGGIAVARRCSARQA